MIIWRIAKFFILTVILLDLLSLGTFFYLEREVGLSQSEGEYRSITVSIQDGAGARDIARILKEEGAINNEFIFLYFVWREDAAHRLQAGTYKISSGESIRAITEILIGGNAQSSSVRVTIPEGFSASQIESRLRNSGVGLQEDEFVSAAGISVGLAREIYEFSFLRNVPKNVSLDGYLFPDTYEFAREGNVTEIIRRMLANFEIRAMPVWENARVSRGLHEMITLASLLEKEVRTPEDMRLVAGIFEKRLAAGMPLQADATLAYLTGKSTEELSSADKLFDSRYNTYKYRGLPPGPINNPGMRAIEAALNPEKSAYWYYLSTPEGETVFSKTLDEHNKNKIKYLR